jgi:hypothetical protein
MQKSTPEAPEAAGGAPEPVEEVVEEAAVTAGGAEPIRSAPMTEATASSRGRIELLADDLVEPAMAAKHLEAIRQAEQWMKVSRRSF